MLTRHFAQEPAAMLDMGNHYVIRARGQHASPGVTHAPLPASIVELCHVPVRSIAQFVVMIATQHLAHVAAHRHFQPARQRADGALWRGEPPTPEHMFGAHVVATGSRGVAVADARVIDTDDRPPFLADIPLLYTRKGCADTLPFVAAAVERLVRQLRRDAAGATTDASRRPSRASAP
ncbi:MAG: hypothetical protein IPG84_20205 [Betaproteobacteria bacterium]|nr:hypothetical protein [Betaproteobacteria bacterium]